MPTASLPNQRLRASLLSQLRAELQSQGLLEVNTPQLWPSAIPESEIDLFTLPEGHLMASPEAHMKRLLAAGFGPIYQICPAFRRGELGQRHNPQFTILEFYLPGVDDQGLMRFLDQVSQKLFDLPPCQVQPYLSAFAQATGLDYHHFTPAQALQLCQAQGLPTPAGEMDRRAWTDFLFSFLVQPRLGLGAPLFLTRFPADQASLARLDSTDARLSRRFEWFYQGLELGNGFWELADVAEQTRRLAAQPGKVRLDQGFLAALEAGLPEASGVAIGIERLLMALHGGDFKDWFSFPWPQE